MSNSLFAVGSVGDAAERYHTDVAEIWSWIASGRVVTNPDGKRVRLVADPVKRDDSKWLIEEESA